MPKKITGNRGGMTLDTIQGGDTKARFRMEEAAWATDAWGDLHRVLLKALHSRKGRTDRCAG